MVIGVIALAAVVSVSVADADADAKEVVTLVQGTGTTVMVMRTSASQMASNERSVDFQSRSVVGVGVVRLAVGK
jgi:hypothetical protein